MTRHVRNLVVLLSCVAALAIAAGASSAAARPQVRLAPVVRVQAVGRPATAAAMAKFLLHAGIAYYVFDHYIWKPYKAGDLHGFTHVVKIAEAGLAAVFVYHEVKLMASDVKGSKVLSFLTAPIAAAIAKLSSLKSSISGGKLSAVGGVNSQLGSIQQKAGSKGVVIKEIQHAL